MTTYNDILEEFGITPGNGDCDDLLDVIDSYNMAIDQDNLSDYDIDLLLNDR